MSGSKYEYQDEPAARRTLRECCAREPDLHIGEFVDARTRAGGHSRPRRTQEKAGIKILPLANWLDALPFD